MTGNVRTLPVKVGSNKGQLCGVNKNVFTVVCRRAKGLSMNPNKFIRVRQ